MAEENKPKVRRADLLAGYLGSIVKYIPILYVLLVFVGYLNLYFYYRFFNIDISNYLTITEILTAFLPVITEAVVYTFIIFILILLLFFSAIRDGIREARLGNKVDEGNSEIVQKLSDRNLSFHYTALRSKETYVRKNMFNKVGAAFPHVLFIIATIGWFLLALGLIYIPINSLVIRNYNFPSSLIESHIIFILGIVFLSVLIAVNFKKQFYYLVISTLTSKYGLFAYFIIIIFVNQYWQAYFILDRHYSKAVSITFTDNSIVKTDTNFVFIGQTQNNVFFRNLKEGTNSIYMTSNIKSIVMK